MAAHSRVAVCSSEVSVFVFVSASISASVSAMDARRSTIWESYLPAGREACRRSAKDRATTHQTAPRLNSIVKLPIIPEGAPQKRINDLVNDSSNHY